MWTRSVSGTMVKLYTSLDRVPKGRKFCRFPNLMFKNYIRESDLDDNDLKLIEELEGYHAEWYGDANTFLLRSKYDTTASKYLPYGIQTLIFIRHVVKTKDKKGMKWCYNVSSCNSKILEKIFEIVDDTDILLYLRHIDVIACKNREYRVNRKKAYTAVELKNLLIEQLEKE